MLTTQEVMAVYFRAMLAGWTVDNTSPNVEPAFPPEKVFPYPEDQFTVVDRFVSRSDSYMSAGTTTIWFNEEPIWIMHYWGWYNPLVVPFLKKRLAETYAKGVWMGGRGTRHEEVTAEGITLVYENHPAFNSFINDRGFETIWSPNHGTSDFGHHDYVCLSLVPLD